jgi:gas vesicle protein
MRRMIGFMIGILIGALVGSTVALLLAPEAGAELRGSLKARGQGLLAEVREAAEIRRAELTDRLQALRSPRTGTSELT